MRSQLRAPNPALIQVTAPGAYTAGVNSGQQPGGTAGYRVPGRWGRLMGGALTTLVRASLVLAALSAGTAFADEPAPKKAAPKARLVITGNPAANADDILPVAEEAPEAKASRGVVTLLRGGQPIGLGTVLKGDGRILTALSPLGSGNDLEAKYADDTVQKLKLGHHDRVWDLALLVPQGGKWKEGLSASSADPMRDDATIRSFSGAKGKPAATPVELRTKRSLIGGDDRVLEQALELGSRITAKDLGSPLIDERGRVVGVLGRACLPIEGKPCSPVAYGIPVSAIKGFLKTVPPDAVPPAAWLGIQGAPESSPVVKGVRVLSVAKGSPASEAKLKGGEKGAGDMIVGVGGKPVTTTEELASAIKEHAIGEKVPLTVFSKGMYRTVDVVLKAPPDTGAKAAPAPAPAESEGVNRLVPPSANKAVKDAKDIVERVKIKPRKAGKPGKPEAPAKPEKPAKPKAAPKPADDDGDEEMFAQPL